MFCGTSSFHSVDDDSPAPASGPSTPKASRNKKSSSSSKNPYSSRGLDKFTSVLSELEARREKIMARTGSQGVAMVRFMYSNSQDWIPIVVRMREEEGDKKPAKGKDPPAQPAALQQPPKVEVEPADPKPPAAPAAPPPAPMKVMKKSFSWGGTGEGMNRGEWWRWRPEYYMPAAAVLTLLSLVIFGRMFAICCMSIWWYLMPTLNGNGWGDNKRRSWKRKEYARRMGDKRLPAPAVGGGAAQARKIGGGGLHELGSPRAQGIGKRG
ncbi:hypothetical protein AXF42_Ash004357 [Apostasia shenzhenica]|uniref:Uncharacterized protein n=1 Tax=Apostasia shenzhenica TaxID=1088818 RepID=A0A2I0A2P0_9ASPA|nr:hypothetical protein AXF42_Ash004357 [Apostasia shenzhenica]